MREISAGILFLFAFIIKGQEVNVVRYSVDEGLTQTSVNAISQDINGRVWAGTYGGLDIFNGQFFTKLDSISGLYGKSIVSIYKDSQNRMWLSTAREILLFDGKSFRNITQEYQLRGLKTNRFYEDQEGIIWFCRDQELLYLENEEVHTLNIPENPIVRSIQKYDGAYWIATEFGIYIYDGRSVRPSFINRKLSDKNIYSLYRGEEGLFIGSSRYLMVLKKGELIDYGRQVGVTQSTIYDIKPSIHNGGIMLATSRGAYHVKDGVAIDILGVTEVSDRICFSIYEDNAGQIWAGTYQGVALYKGGEIQYYSPKSGLPEEAIFSIHKDKKGRLWMGDTQGNIIVVDERGKLRVHKSGLEQSIQTISSDHLDRIWIATNGLGVLMVEDYQPDDFQFRSFNVAEGIAGQAVFDLQIDNGKVWTYSNMGVNSIDLETLEVQRWDNKNGLPRGAFYTGFHDSEGYIWLADWGKGVWRFYPEKGQVKDLINYSNEHSLSRSVLSLLEDERGYIYVGSADEGIQILDPAKDYELKKHYTKENGLTSQTLFLMGKSPSGEIWLGSEIGVDVIRFDADFNIEKKVFVGPDQGFIGKETNHNAICFDKEKTYIGTIHNATIISDRFFEKKQSGIRLQFRDLRLFYTERDVGDQHKGYEAWSFLPKELKLPYNRNHLTFDFEAIDYSGKGKLLYRWKLEGADKNWTPARNTSEILYSNLSPGKYALRLQASRDGVSWEKDGEIAYEFEIQPPFWLSWWFVSIVVLSLSLIAWAVIRYRERALQREKELLEEKVSVRTDQLRQEKEHVLEQQKLLEETNDALELKNKLVMDSINYAQRIQNAMIPSRCKLEQAFEEVFVLYRPKDIVSGDFYWFYETENSYMIAAVDCTGHGVPGAFMSFIANNLLNEIVKVEGVTEPGEILNRAHQLLPSKLDQQNEKVADSMDIALCVIEKETRLMKFSGAHNPVFIYRKGELIVIKGDNIHLGMSNKIDRKFQTHEFQLQKGDSFYIFSDGYPDQIGGEKKKRLKIGTFMKLIRDNAELSLVDQEKSLDDFLIDWQRDYGQYDDILVIGMKA